MARKVKDDTPAGGWLGPRMADENGDRGPTVATHYAHGVSNITGKWLWKPIDEVYERKCAKLRAEAGNPKKKKKAA